MKQLQSHLRAGLILLLLTLFLTACNVDVTAPGGLNSTSGSYGTNQPIGTGAQGLQVFVEPDAGTQPIMNAIQTAKQSVWLEIYLLTNKQVISALEEAANRGLDVRVMLEPHPYGSGSVSPTETLARLKAAGIKAQPSSPDFSLTHEKGLLIDGSTAYIMTSNFTNAALGASSGVKNREYDIIDTNAEDVKAIGDIFQADWNHTQVQLNDPNLVVSPLNSRTDFSTLIQSAKSSLLIEAEEMNDSTISQAIASAAQRGVKVQVILPSPQSSSDSNQGGIETLTQGGVSVREDPQLYMHAKIIVVDAQKAFVGSENISKQSLDQNRELGILLADQQVLTTLQQTFQQDWGDSRSV